MEPVKPGGHASDEPSDVPGFVEVAGRTVWIPGRGTRGVCDAAIREYFGQQNGGNLNWQRARSDQRRRSRRSQTVQNPAIRADLPPRSQAKHYDRVILDSSGIGR